MGRLQIGLDMLRDSTFTLSAAKVSSNLSYPISLLLTLWTPTKDLRNIYWQCLKLEFAIFLCVSFTDPTKPLLKMIRVSIVLAQN